MAEDFCFRVESLITAVEKRSILYNKKHRDYNNKDDKEQAWMEVCAEILPQWYDYEDAERNSKLVQVQKKWRNLRDSFRKDLNVRRQIKPARNSSKRKREYIYSRSMLFLEPYIKPDDGEFQKFYLKPDVEVEIDEEEEEEETHEAEVLKFESEESQYTDTSVPAVRKKKAKVNTQVDQQSPVLEVWEGFQNGDVNDDNNFYLHNEVDEDRYFLLSLVPSFRNLSQQQKLSVRVEFLQILQKHCFTPVQDPLNESQPD
ncbi:uncharacterized protein LOC114339139 [Diabrotica virgifera virgifera]|uniref:Uncharacterized protein LOC114339139 n=1 Tax=Diabrotica virgifera virgifera TaxID=50390 RepID=A0A6P7GK36_DIAVI|nr:uncharacterized protein LOC114339139 [Diabrotica virgifera virgifera]